MSTQHYPTWRRRHEAVLHYMLEHPAARYCEVARATGYSEWHISRIANAPEFQSRLQAHLDTACDDAARRMLAGR